MPLVLPLYFTEINRKNCPTTSFPLPWWEGIKGRGKMK
jgi:hypothetical protein